jgi:glutamate dehydrogenase
VIDAVLRTNAFAPLPPRRWRSSSIPRWSPACPSRCRGARSSSIRARVEGIHLRSGAVARGGLRWSDRRDDFRTEILGLMKAQRVKNAVIVPTGAKGGFYPKQLPDPRSTAKAGRPRAGPSYEIFIRTLLSITDNIVGGKVVHPAAWSVLDGEDPYFVVAADKGTATFSDIANGIAQEPRFWLDDAFASGGSNGYDHKAMGITARGAWVSVQRHFREMGIDVQKDRSPSRAAATCRAMCSATGCCCPRRSSWSPPSITATSSSTPRSRSATSWKERKRMFALPRSSWEDYDKALISKGGGVFPRSAKVIKLSKQARDAGDRRGRRRSSPKR